MSKNSTKLIVIAGSARNLGKTHLLREIGHSLLPSRVESLKIGHGAPSPEKPERLFHDPVAAWNDVQERRHQDPPDFFLIETGTLPEAFSPDLLIFLVAPSGEEKPRSHLIKARAHLIIDRHFSPDTLNDRLASLLGDTRPAPALIGQFHYLYGETHG